MSKLPNIEACLKLMTKQRNYVSPCNPSLGGFQLGLIDFVCGLSKEIFQYPLPV